MKIWYIILNYIELRGPLTSWYRTDDLTEARFWLSYNTSFTCIADVSSSCFAHRIMKYAVSAVSCKGQRVHYLHSQIQLLTVLTLLLAASVYWTVIIGFIQIFIDQWYIHVFVDTVITQLRLQWVQLLPWPHINNAGTLFVQKIKAFQEKS